MKVAGKETGVALKNKNMKISHRNNYCSFAVNRHNANTIHNSISVREKS